MRIAVVGAGTRCLYLMNLIEQCSFHVVFPVIVAVADINNNAPGFVHAKKLGLPVTTDYNDLFIRDDIDLIVELTGNLDIYNDILTKKKQNVRAIAHTTALLFWEISSFSNIQKEMEQRLKKKQIIYELMINELIQEDVIIIGLDYRIIDINDTLLNRIGLKRDEAIGHFCYEITHHESNPCSGDQHPCPLKKVVRTGKPSQTTHIHLGKDDTELYFSISCYPFIENDKIAGVIEVSKDITRDIQIQKAMMQQEKMVSIGRLSAGVAHEINNPLTTILTSAMLTQEEVDPNSSVYQELKTISGEALRCRKIVKSLLDFSRQTKPTKRMSGLNDVVQESFVLTRKQAAFDDICVTVDFEENLPPVNIDKDQIQQTLINLALNAIEATPAGGSVKLKTRYLPETKMVQVDVSDTGVGIAPENIDKIFEPFFTTRENGTGLGLAISHGIIEQHGGTIKVESQLGQGTHFIISLPLNKGD
ncbi:MAG: ATP-binding protein [Desulfobacterales bacterium]